MWWCYPVIIVMLSCCHSCIDLFTFIITSAFTSHLYIYMRFRFIEHRCLTPSVLVEPDIFMGSASTADLKHISKIINHIRRPTRTALGAFHKSTKKMKMNHERCVCFWRSHADSSSLYFRIKEGRERAWRPNGSLLKGVDSKWISLSSLVSIPQHTCLNVCVCVYVCAKLIRVSRTCVRLMSIYPGGKGVTVEDITQSEEWALFCDSSPLSLQPPHNPPPILPARLD